MSEPECVQIDRIIDVARGAAPFGPSQRENREATRIPYTSDVAMVVVSPSGAKLSPHLLNCENISTGGLCVMSPSELPVGSRGGVLIMKSDGEVVVLGAKVVYANSGGAGRFECGLEFERETSLVTMDDFRDPVGNLPQIGPAKAA